MKKLLGLLLTLSMIVALAGCATEATPATATTEKAESNTDTTDNAKDETKEVATEGLSGAVTISGSTSVEKIGLALAEEFMALNPDVEVTYEAIGSSAGVKNANEGVTMIGTASRAIKEKEQAWGMTENVLAFDGIAVAVNPANGVTGLTMDQLTGIYKGEITNWSDVGGADEAIVVVSREDGSGTRGAFEEIVDFEGTLTVDALIAEGNGNVQTTVAGNPQAIGYISFSTIDDTISALKVNGAEAKTDNVLNGSYPVSRPFNMVFHDANMTDASLAFVAFALSAEGQVVVEAKGGISATGAGTSEAATEPANLSGAVTISGSTSVEKIGLALAEEFMALNPDVEVTYEAIGSSAGVKNANEGVTMIGTASRAIKEKEEAWGMTAHVLAFDGIAVAVNPANGVTGLTMEQLTGIYKGEITNWSDVGGADEAIVVVSREDGSGTRGAFEEIVDFEGALTVDALIAEGNGNVQTTVAGNPQAIGYISFSTIDDTITALNVNDAEAKTENVLNSSYPVSRPFNMVFHDANMTDASNAFVAFVLSADGQEIVAAKGGIPVN